MKKVLLIEDNTDLLDSLGSYLDLEGFKVVNAENGSEGIEKAIHELPDIIVCDISMPNLDGFQVYKILQQNSNTFHIPFIFLSAKDQIPDIRAGMQLGADDYITKPFDFDELVTTIRTRIEKREKQIEETAKDYKILIENPLLGVFILQDHRIVFANPKISKISGYSLYELRTMNILDIVVQDDKRDLVKKIVNCNKGINRTFAQKFRIIHRRKRIISLHMNAGLTRYNRKSAILGAVITAEENRDEQILATAINEYNLRALESTLVYLEEEKPQDVPKEMVLKLVQIIRKKYPTIQNTVRNPDKLSKRELEVLQLISEGNSSQKIGEKLHLSTRTVERHRANLLSKTDSGNTVDLIIYAIRNNLITI